MPENMSEMLKGVLEGMVLEIIGQGEVYGYEIVKKLQGLGFKDIAEGTVYTVLTRIERGHLVSIVRRPSALGPPRKFYTLNTRGKEELRAFWSRWETLKQRIDDLKCEA
ncbi:MAG: PadR family transcriptional regulator [Eggerthellaceae bacterium]|jgi:PadR family transcriptional regulator PadR|nr:PadR family transcriptional regulator [Eggerthellaceae bacterium]